jgi:hypothetical protein
VSALAILGWIKEAAIFGAIGWIVWFLIHSGGSEERVKELQALNTQIALNAKQSAEAQKHVESDISAINARIDKQSKPVLVYVPRAVPDAPKAASSPAPSGPVDQGPGIDIRPGINEFEKRYEKSLAECRGILESWPK